VQYLNVEQGELVLAKRSKPSPKSDECLIKVRAIGVNRADVLQRQGKYPPPEGESDILGLEVCGEIVEKGNEVQSWQLAEQVFGLVAGGAYAEYVVIKASHMMLLPKTLTATQGAALRKYFLPPFRR